MKTAENPSYQEPILGSMYGTGNPFPTAPPPPSGSPPYVPSSYAASYTAPTGEPLPFYQPPPGNPTGPFYPPPPQVVYLQATPLPTTATPPAPPPGPPAGASPPGAPSKLTAMSSVVSSFSSLSLGLAIFIILTCGWCVVSSILLIALSCLLKNASSNETRLAALIEDVKGTAPPPSDCCGRKSKQSTTMMNLAISVIFFASCELCLAIGLGLGLGGGLGQPVPSFALTSGKDIQVCGSTATNLTVCLTRVTSARYTYSSSSNSTFNSPLALYQVSSVGSSQYLLYGGGATLVGSCVIIALGAVVRKFLDALKSM